MDTNHLNLFGFWLFQIPLAYLLAKYFEMGRYRCFYRHPGCRNIYHYRCFILFKKGKWKKVKV